MPVVKVTEPDSAASIARETEITRNPQLPTPVSSQSSPPNISSNLAIIDGVSSQPSDALIETHEAPTPPPSYLEATLQSVNQPAMLTRAATPGHSRSYSETPVNFNSLLNRHSTLDGADNVGATPIVSAPRPFRPLPKPPTLSIDTVNILPSHIGTPQQVLNNLPPLEPQSLTPKGGNASGPVSTPLTATYRTPGLSVPPRGPSTSPQYTLPTVPPLLLKPAPDVNVFSGKLATESAAPSKGIGSASQRTQTNLRHKQTSFRTFKDLDSWREVILYELEETYNHDLPRDRTSGAGTTKLAPLYPVRHLCILLCVHIQLTCSQFTAHYGHQYLTWLENQAGFSSLPSVQ